MKKKYEKIILRLLNVLFIFQIFIIIVLLFQRHDNIMFKNESVITLHSDWNYFDSSGIMHVISLPASLDAGNDNAITLSCRLPSAINHMNSLGVLTTHQSIVAYLGNDRIYAREIPPGSRFLNVPTGSIWDIISLPPESEGKTLTIQFSSKYKAYAGKINEIHVGTSSSLLLYNIRTFGLSFLLSLLIFINAIFLIILYYFFKWLIPINKDLLYLGCFSVLASVWMIMESNLTQLFIDNAFIISSLSYLSLMIFPLPILYYIAASEGYHYRKVMYISAFSLIFNDFILILLQFFNILDFHETLPAVRFEIVIVLGIALITLYLETFRHKNKDIRTFTISSSILFIFGLIELFFYIAPSEKTRGGFFQIGFIIFISLLAWDMIKKAVNIIKLSESAKHYKYLATRDLLTNCRNRVSYAKDLDRIDLSRNITLFMVDLNSMKLINDSFGHQAGDEALILSSQCLLKVFGRRVYRIGGDEFVCIAYDLSLEEIQHLLTLLNAECSKASEDVPYKIGMTAGYAIYDKTIDKSIYETVTRADQDMYNHKHNGNT